MRKFRLETQHPQQDSYQEQTPRLLFFEELPSTNDYAKEHWTQLEDFTIIRAKTQTKGRGRLQRQWCSPLGGLWFTMFFSSRLTEPHFYQRLAGISVLEAIESFFPADSLPKTLFLKWPNDIVFFQKDEGVSKIAGILQENLYIPDLKGCIVGVGLNVNNTIPEELRSKAMSLKEITQNDWNIESLFETIVERVRENHQSKSDLLNTWKEKSLIREGDYIELYIEQEQRVITGRLCHDSVEAIELITPEGETKRFFAGDVHLILDK